MKLNDDNLFHIGVISQQSTISQNIPPNVPLKTICLLPPLIVLNCLPRDLKIYASKTEQYLLLEPSAQMTFYQINPMLDSKVSSNNTGEEAELPNKDKVHQLPLPSSDTRNRTASRHSLISCRAILQSNACNVLARVEGESLDPVGMRLSDPGSGNLARHRY